MKILHVIAQLPSKTGSGVYYSNLIEGFKKFKYEQRAVFAFQDENTWNVLDKEYQYPVEFKTKSIPFPIAGMSDVMPYENTVYSTMTEEMIKIWKNNFIEILKKVKEEFEPEIIFSHHLWILTSIVCDIFPNSKIIGLCHNTDLRQSEMNEALKEKYVNNINKLDLILAISELQRQRISDIYNINIEKIISVGGGFNKNIFYPPKEKKYTDTVRLVFCAKIDPSKGIYELIEVYKSLGIKNISLDIIGNPNKDNYKKLFEYIDGDETIKLYNVKSQEDLADTLRDKDIFLMPSYYEGLGLMAIESLACGLYTVTTEIEALISLLGDEINNSGIIKYVPLPRIYDTDKPLQEDLTEFKKNLKTAILEQIEKIKRKETFPDEVYEKINKCSWESLVDKINSLIY